MTFSFVLNRVAYECAFKLWETSFCPASTCVVCQLQLDCREKGHNGAAAATWRLRPGCHYSTCRAMRGLFMIFSFVLNRVAYECAFKLWETSF